MFLETWKAHMICWCLVYHLHRVRQFFLQIRFHTLQPNTFFRIAKSETTGILNSMSIATQKPQKCNKIVFSSRKLRITFQFPAFDVRNWYFGMWRESKHEFNLWNTRFWLLEIISCRWCHFAPFVCTTRIKNHDEGKLNLRQGNLPKLLMFLDISVSDENVAGHEPDISLSHFQKALKSVSRKYCRWHYWSLNRHYVVSGFHQISYEWNVSGICRSEHIDDLRKNMINWCSFSAQSCRMSCR